ncbi:ankyrin repeat domain-containing protein [Streptomyces sp. NPDC051582]|uniref:ankyrin repeat domain-containing protein n=1 Tax=Streptomyces sp. NPDC051582 TaxID=3155167 RepID=UPI00344A04BF
MRPRGSGRGAATTARAPVRSVGARRNLPPHTVPPPTILRAARPRHPRRPRPPRSLGSGGTPLADACAFGPWRAARRLLELGARPDLHEAAALGPLDRVTEFLTAGSLPADELTAAFWAACHGGQLSTARYLLSDRVDVDWVGYGESTPLDAAVTSGNDALIDWLRTVGARTRAELPPA